MTPHFHQKREAWLSIVTKNTTLNLARFWIVLSIFGEKAKSNFAFSAKVQS
jgi:hypothetical protein